MKDGAGARAAPRDHPLGTVTRALLLLAGLLPFVPRLLGGVPGLDWIAGAVDAWFGFQCHRDPGRSLTLLGEILPVCSRCTGIYWGLGLGALVLRPRLDVWPLRIWVGSAAFVMVLDVATEVLGMRPASTWLRLVTGLLLSYPVAGAAVLAARAVGRPDPPGGA